MLRHNVRVIQQLFTPSVQHTLDLVGIFVFAISGALLAVRKNFDVFGIAVLAEVTALGGGLFRDLVIGAVPPAAFTDLGYFLTPLLAALLVIFLHPQVERIQMGVNVFDAAGLGLFCVTGTTKAYDYGSTSPRRRRWAWRPPSAGVCCGTSWPTRCPHCSAGTAISTRSRRSWAPRWWRSASATTPSPRWPAVSRHSRRSC